jgi:hypothetical protein
VDAKAGTASASVCVVQFLGNSCSSRILAGAATYPTTTRPQLAVSSSGKVAYTTDSVYIQGASDKLGPAGWGTAPAWTVDGASVAITQFMGQTTDASGATRFQTNIVFYKNGQAGTTLVAGGSNLAFAPA